VRCGHCRLWPGPYAPRPDTASADTDTGTYSAVPATNPAIAHSAIAFSFALTFAIAIAIAQLHT